MCNVYVICNVGVPCHVECVHVICNMSVICDRECMCNMYMKCMYIPVAAKKELYI